MADVSGRQQSPYFRTKPVETILEEAQKKEGGLKRVLSAIDLTAIGVGAIIGAGIFVLTGKAAAETAGPGIMLSYVFAGLICILCALCYAEFAARLPISGSAYTYAYASVGELFAWIIGWDLILEYAIGASTVAVGWAEYLGSFLKGFNIDISPIVSVSIPAITTPFFVIDHVNLLAGLIIALLSTLLAIGIKESARFNLCMVLLKLGVVIFVILTGAFWVKPENWSPFLPYGVAGVFSGAAAIFFAYIGFDAVSTAAEEVENPQRDLPRGIVGSLLICTLLYVLVSAVITGMVPYAQIDKGAPLAEAFNSVNADWAGMLIGLGGVAGLTTVILILLLSQPRIFYSMARDGLILPWFAHVHEKFKTPFNATIVTGVVAGVTAMVVPMDHLHHMVSIGTLFAFALVSACVLISRYKTSDKPMQSTWMTLVITLGLGIACFAAGKILDEPQLFGSWNSETQNLLLGLVIAIVPTVMLGMKKNMNVPETFKCPWVPVVPVTGMFGSILMMVRLPWETWGRLGWWLAAGLLIYAFYGLWHSKLNPERKV